MCRKSVILLFSPVLSSSSIYTSMVGALLCISVSSYLSWPIYASITFTLLQFESHCWWNFYRFQCWLVELCSKIYECACPSSSHASLGKFIQATFPFTQSKECKCFPKWEVVWSEETLTYFKDSKSLFVFALEKLLACGKFEPWSLEAEFYEANAFPLS